MKERPVDLPLLLKKSFKWKFLLRNTHTNARARILTQEIDGEIEEIIGYKDRSARSHIFLFGGLVRMDDGGKRDMSVMLISNFFI